MAPPNATPPKARPPRPTSCFVSEAPKPSPLAQGSHRDSNEMLSPATTVSHATSSSTSPAAWTSPGERGRSLFGNTSAVQTTPNLFGRAADSTNASSVLNQATARGSPLSGGQASGQPATSTISLFGGPASQTNMHPLPSSGGPIGRPAGETTGQSTIFYSQASGQPGASTGGLFSHTITGQPQPSASSGSLFESQATRQAPTSTGGLFNHTATGQPQTSASSGSLFGGQLTQQGGQTNEQPSASTSGLFGSQSTVKPAVSSSWLFSSQTPRQDGQTSTEQPTASAGSIFDGSATQPTTPTSLFGSTTGQPQTSAGHFAGQPTGQSTTSSGGLFGNRTTGQPTSFSFTFGAAASPARDRLSTPPAAGNLGISTGSMEVPINTTQVSGSLFTASPVAPASNPPLSGQTCSLSLMSDLQASRPASKNTSALGASDGNASTPQQPQQREWAYDIACEELQVHEFFSSSVTTAIREAEKIAGELNVAVSETQEEVLEDLDLNRLRARARLKIGHNVRKQTIAVVGDSGQGKSSLINSLLHVPGIAHTSDTGSACTSVVTEYHQKSASHENNITIHVQFYSGAALEDLVEELAWSYRQLYLPSAQRSELMSDQDYAKYQKESDEAWSALHAAFQHQEGFSAEFFRDVSDGAADRINQQLMQWTREIKWPGGGKILSADDMDWWCYFANSADECCEITRAFMKDGLWPFTKLIRVYLKCPILDGGVILADLPGLHDTNLARVKATQDYLLGCDRILIVSRISRAITDQSVESILFGVVARHMPMEWKESGGKKLKLAVVCTEAENINIRTAMTEFCGEGKRISSEAMERLEADVQTAKASGDRGHLDVFCVGNQAYEKFCRKGNAEFVRASGIPKLRQFCITITADDRLLDARHVVQSELPSLLNSADLWMSSNMSHGAFDELDQSNMLQHLENMRSQVPKYITQLREEFVDCFNEQIMGLLVPQEHKWRSTAIEAAKTWETWRWNSYNAWCRHCGKHSMSTHENIDWNAQIIWKMRMELAFAWETLEEEVPTLFKQLTDKVSNELTWFKDDTILQASATPQRDLLIDSVDATGRLFKNKVVSKELKLARGLAQIRRKASESNETSYILGEMLSAYRAASSHSGNEMFKLQKAEVGGHIRSETLFTNIAIQMSEDVDALARGTEKSVGKVVKQVMEGLDHDVKMALKEGELAAGAENSVTRLKKVVDRLRNRLKELPQF